MELRVAAGDFVPASLGVPEREALMLGVGVSEIVERVNPSALPLPTTFG